MCKQGDEEGPQEKCRRWWPELRCCKQEAELERAEMKMFGFFGGVTRNQIDSIRVTVLERFQRLKRKGQLRCLRRQPGGLQEDKRREPNPRRHWEHCRRKSHTETPWKHQAHLSSLEKEKIWSWQQVFHLPPR